MAYDLARVKMALQTASDFAAETLDSQVVCSPRSRNEKIFVVLLVVLETYGHHHELSLILNGQLSPGAERRKEVFLVSEVVDFHYLRELE